MTMKPLSEVLAGMPSELPVAPVRKVAAVVTERDTLVVSKLLEQLKVIFPAWQRSFPTPEMQDRALGEWTVALVEANCTSREQLSLGMRVARSQGIPFFPGPGMFIKWCEITPESMGLPSLDTALVEVHPSSRRAGRQGDELGAPNAQSGCVPPCVRAGIRPAAAPGRCRRGSWDGGAQRAANA